jgi:hypothetical protein
MVGVNEYSGRSAALPKRGCGLPIARHVALMFPTLVKYIVGNFDNPSLPIHELL